MTAQSRPTLDSKESAAQGVRNKRARTLAFGPDLGRTLWYETTMRAGWLSGIVWGVRSIGQLHENDNRFVEFSGWNRDHVGNPVALTA